MAQAAIPLAIAQGGISLYGASQANRARQRAARVRSEQFGEAAEVERRKAEIDALATRSRLRLLAAESGLGFAGSFEDLSRQADIDEQINLSIIDRNLYNQRRGLWSEVSAQYQNPLLAGFMGSMGGYATGLQIENDYAAANPPTETRPMPEDYR